MNTINAKNESPLYLACLNNENKIAISLLEMGGNLGTATCDDVIKCPLRICCRNGNIDLVKILTEKNVSPNGIHLSQIGEGIYRNNSYTDWYRFGAASDLQSPLCTAVDIGYHDIAKLLIKSGAEIDAMHGVIGKSALHFAIEFCGEKRTYIHSEIGIRSVKMLLKAGAHVNKVNNRGQSSLQIALGNLRSKYLKRYWYTVLKLGLATELNIYKMHVDLCIEVVKLLVEYGAFIGDNCPDMEEFGVASMSENSAPFENFFIPLHYPQEIVFHLLKAGAGTNRLAWAYSRTSRRSSRPTSTRLAQALVLTTHHLNPR